MKDLIEEIQREIQKENIDGVMDCYTVKVGKSGQAVKRRFNDQLKALTAVDGLKKDAENDEGIVEVDIKDKTGDEPVDAEIEGDISFQVDDIFAKAVSGEKPEDKEDENGHEDQNGGPESEEERDIKEVLAEFKDGTNFDDKEGAVAQVSIDTGDIETNIETDKHSADKQDEEDSDSDEILDIDIQPEDIIVEESGPDFAETVAESPDFKFEETMEEKPEFALDESDDDSESVKDKEADFDRPVVAEEGLDLDAPFDESDDELEAEAAAGAEVKADNKAERQVDTEAGDDDDVEYMNKKEMLKYVKSKGIDDKAFAKLRKLSEETLRKKIKTIFAGKAEPEEKKEKPAAKKKSMRMVYIGSGIFAGIVIIAALVVVFMSSGGKKEYQKVAAVSGDAAGKPQKPSTAVAPKKINQTVLVEDKVSKELERARKEPVPVPKVPVKPPPAVESIAPEALQEEHPPVVAAPPPPPMPIQKVEAIPVVPEQTTPARPAQVMKHIDKYLPQGVALSGMMPNPDGAYPYAIHIGSYKDHDNAVNLVIELRKEGLLAYTSYVTIPGKGVWYRAFIGFYGSQEDAQKFALKLTKEKSMEANVVKKPYVIQIGVFSSDMELTKVESDLWAKGYTPYSIKDSRDAGKRRLVVGAFDTKKEALDQVERLKNENFVPGIVTR